MGHQPKQIYEFGPYRLDSAERLLMRDGAVVPLQPKIFDLLLALVERHGRLLEKDELMRLVWPDTFVEEANLASNISILRKKLSENGERCIETVPKHGYRFVAPVREFKEQNGNFSGEEQPESLKVIKERLDGTSDEIAWRTTSTAEYLIVQINRRKRSVLFVLATLIVAVTSAAYWLYPLISQRRLGAPLHQDRKSTRLKSSH